MTIDGVVPSRRRSTQRVVVQSPAGLHRPMGGNGYTLSTGYFYEADELIVLLTFKTAELPVRSTQGLISRHRQEHLTGAGHIDRSHTGLQHCKLKRKMSQLHDYLHTLSNRREIIHPNNKTAEAGSTGCISWARQVGVAEPQVTKTIGLYESKLF